MKLMRQALEEKNIRLFNEIKVKFSNDSFLTTFFGEV
jgi:hypothetical protein